MIIDILGLLGGYEIYGISDSHDHTSRAVLDRYTVNIQDDNLQTLYPKVTQAFISHGKDLSIRRDLYQSVIDIGYELPILVSPQSTVSPHVKMAAGTLVVHNATINAASKIGSNVIVNTGAIIEHDTVIGNHTHIAPGAVICGEVRVGDMTLIGANSVIIPGVSIGNNVVVGAGSVVVNNIDNNTCVAGNPARPIPRADRG